MTLTIIGRLRLTCFIWKRKTPTQKMEVFQCPRFIRLPAIFASLKLAKFDMILIRFSSFSILYNFENNGFSTHYFSFHTLLVPIQYQLFFVFIVCSSGGLQVI